MVYMRVYVDVYTGGGSHLTPGTNWHNELGSVMKISQVDKIKGTFTGALESADEEPSKSYPLNGRFDPEGCTLGWVVTFKNKHGVDLHKTTSWSGLIQVDWAFQRPIILTTWLLTHEHDWPSDYFNSTNVGFDTFMETPRRSKRPSVLN